MSRNIALETRNALLNVNKPEEKAQLLGVASLIAVTRPHEPGSREFTIPESQSLAQMSTRPNNIIELSERQASEAAAHAGEAALQMVA